MDETDDLKSISSFVEKKIGKKTHQVLNLRLHLEVGIIENERSKGPSEANAQG